MRLNNQLAGLIAWAILFGLSPSLVQAVPVVGVVISNDGPAHDTGEWNLGYSFVVNSPTNVVSLGVWDQFGNGLLNGHQVGLWDSSQNLLASTTVPAGVAGILDNGFRFANIPAVPLSVGQTYYVAGTFHGPGDDPYTVDPTSLVTAPQITYDSRRFEFGSTLIFPGLVGSDSTGYWGGNVRLDVVPEPSCFVLALLGLMGLHCRQHILRKRIPG